MKIRKVACVGAGLIGQGWATLFASKGLNIVLQDISEDILAKSMAQISSNLDFLEENGLLPRGKADAAMKRIRTNPNLAQAVTGVDYVQESIPDSYELKKQIFGVMDEASSDHTILASSASGLLMTEIQSVTKRPQRCILAHPILPVHLIPVVEIVGGELTAKNTVRATRVFMSELGKEPVVLNREIPGYVINRLQAALIREAMDLVDKGVTTVEGVENAFCKGMGLRDPFIGPFLRCHLAGSGIEHFFNNYSQSYRYRWETMETWSVIPQSAADAAVKGVYEMERVRSNELEDLKRWRDVQLAKLLKMVREDPPNV